MSCANAHDFCCCFGAVMTLRVDSIHKVETSIHFNCTVDILVG